MASRRSAVRLEGGHDGTHISHRVHFDAPPELVFARGTDPEFMPQYWPKMARIWDVVGRPDEVGSSFRFRERLLGRYYEGRTVVVAVDAPRMQTTLTTYNNGVRVRWEMRMTPTDHGIDGVDESTTRYRGACCLRSQTGSCSAVCSRTH